jgi:CheY-like chemotaxis protein
MKKIIIARSILHAIGGRDTLFSRGTLTIYPARTSEEILNVHGVRKADMIITDIALPFMGGAKLCSAIRNDASLKNVSIIMTCDGTGASAHCREAGANAVLPRSVDPVQLFSKMSELLVIPRRQEIRTLLHGSLAGREGEKSFLGVTHNISISGLLFETDETLKKGGRLTCAVTIGKREVVSPCAVIREERPANGKSRYGVKFLNLDTRSLVIIEQFVKGSIKHSV